jgi:hypothetical protein
MELGAFRKIGIIRKRFDRSSLKKILNITGIGMKFSSLQKAMF